MSDDSNPDQKLAGIRKRIDELDRDIQGLVTERARWAQQVAEAKRAAGETTDFYRPEREADVLRMVKERNQGPLPDEAITRLFREIMSMCLALQEPLRIAFLGPEGTFTQAAAVKHFGHAVVTVPLAAINEVFREVEAGDAHYGVVPVENSTEGVVNHTLDMFLRSPLRICGEVDLRIHHHLLGKAESLDGITRVAAHQQALAQCREWLDTRLPRAERVAVSSNAEAVRRAAEDPAIAAIAGEAAGELYGVPALASNIEDEPDNTTRFLIIGNQKVGSTGRDKTSLLVSAQNRPGALAALLAPFAQHGISMTRIESRPSRQGMWSYVFFVDIDGHIDDPKVAEALTLLDKESSLFKVLGSYPKAIL